MSDVRDQGSGIRDQKKLPAALPPRECWGAWGKGACPLFPLEGFHRTQKLTLASAKPTLTVKLLKALIF
jgi:hypothetical protein